MTDAVIVPRNRKRRKTVPKQNVWSVCVFPTTRQLNRFIRKWDIPGHGIEPVSKMNKTYRMVKIAPWGILAAVCVLKKVAETDDSQLNEYFSKAFNYKELLLFSEEKASPRVLAEKMNSIQALSEDEYYLIFDLMEIPIRRPSEDPSKEQYPRDPPPPPILPNMLEAKTYGTEEATAVSVSEVECTICKTNKKTETLMPCGHMYLCYDCVVFSESKGHLEKCAVCRGTIMGIQHTNW